MFCLLIALALAMVWLPAAGGEGAPGAGKPTGTVLPIVESESVTRECFFANGTPITIREPSADTTGWVHDEEVQAAMEDGFSPKKKPNPGSLISWQEGETTKYVYISGNGKIFGGSLNADVQAEVQITVQGTDVRKGFPNASFLFGGGYGGDILGSVTITLEESQMMYVYGGGYNGSVTGDVTIRSTGTNWSLDMVGGGLASSKTADAVADVGGNVLLDLRGITISYMDTLVCGGLAESISPFTARANVAGSVTVYAEGRNVYQVCGGGEAYRTDENCGWPTADVGGDISLELRDSRVRWYQDKASTLLGGVFGGGLAHWGEATTGGSVEVIVGNTLFDKEAMGVVLGGMAEGKGAVADVEGNASGRVLSGADPARVVRGGVEYLEGAAEVKGDITWSYTLRDGLLDY